MKRHFVMIKPASSLCDLRCTYCFYHDISRQRRVAAHGVMTQETMRKIIGNLYADLDAGDALTIAFQGGEPTLAGLAYFRAFVDEIARQEKRVQVSYALQTNGMAVDEAWCAFFKEHRFLVGLSIDAYAQHHNAHRIDDSGKGTYAQAIAAKRCFDKTGVEYNVLCTLTNALARHPQKVWRFIQEEKIRYIQFTPCLNALSGEAQEWGLTPRRFHRFYTDLFPLWKESVLRGEYISVKFFDDIVNQFVRGEVTACGMQGQCQIQCVLEADGSAYPCDFYVLDAYCGGTLCKQGIKEVREALVQTGFLTERKELPKACGPCKYKKACGGGCKRMERAMYVDDTGFCGYAQVLEDIGQALCDIGYGLLQRARRG